MIIASGAILIYAIHRGIFVIVTDGMKTNKIFRYVELGIVDLQLSDVEKQFEKNNRL